MGALGTGRDHHGAVDDLQPASRGSQAGEVRHADLLAHAQLTLAFRLDRLGKKWE
jgi:hypothetical protein